MLRLDSAARSTTSGLAEQLPTMNINARLERAAFCVRQQCAILSVNLSEAALERNMELGILIRGGSVPVAIQHLIDALVESCELEQV
jgi:hypothetical protein